MKKASDTEREYEFSPIDPEIEIALAIVISIAETVAKRSKDLEEGGVDQYDHVKLVRLARLVFMYACLAAETCPGCRAVDIVRIFHKDGDADSSETILKGMEKIGGSVNPKDGGMLGVIVGVLSEIRAALLESRAESDLPDPGASTRSTMNPDRGPKPSAQDMVVIEGKLPSESFVAPDGSIGEVPGEVLGSLAKSLPRGATVDDIQVRTLGAGGKPRRLTEEEKVQVQAMIDHRGQETH